MKIVRVDIFEYVLPLTKPFVTSKNVFNERRGLIIQGVAENGLIGMGEIAPLFGFSHESISDCLKPAIALAREITKTSIPDSQAALGELMESFRGIPLTVAFGFELMLSDLGAQLAGKQLATWLRSDATRSVTVNAVLAGGDIELQIHDKLANGYGTFKLKIGVDTLPNDLLRIRTIKSLLGQHAKFRLDANRAFDFVTATRILTDLNIVNCEYVEEPLRESDVLELPKLRSESRSPIAIDETLISWCTESEIDGTALSQSQLDAFDVAVCKPALMGSISRTLRLAEILQSHGKKVVVTSSLDSGIGVTAALHCACALKVDVACGLDTTGIFQQQLVSAMPAVTNGRLSLPDGPGLGVALNWTHATKAMLRNIDVD